MPSLFKCESISRNPAARNAMWSMAPVPAPLPGAPPCDVRPRYCFWIAPAIFALGPMCTTSTPPRYIQCTGKPKSGCGPLVMPSTRAYQSRVASMSSAATRKCSMCVRGMHGPAKRNVVIYNDVHLRRQAPHDRGRQEDKERGGKGRRAGWHSHNCCGRGCRRPFVAAGAHGGRQVPFRAFGDHQGGVRGVQQAQYRLHRRRGPIARRAARAGSCVGGRPGALDRDGGRLPDHGGQRMPRRRRRRRRQLGVRRKGRTRGGSGNKGISASMKVASLGMGWWSDVLADAIQRSGKMQIAACFSRSKEKRDKFAAKYGCKAAGSYEEILQDKSIEAIINTTPNSVHRETTIAAARAGKHTG